MLLDVFSIIKQQLVLVVPMIMYLYNKKHEQTDESQYTKVF